MNLNFSSDKTSTVSVTVPSNQKHPQEIKVEQGRFVSFSSESCENKYQDLSPSFFMLELKDDSEVVHRPVYSIELFPKDTSLEISSETVVESNTGRDTTKRTRFYNVLKQRFSSFWEENKKKKDGEKEPVQRETLLNRELENGEASAEPSDYVEETQSEQSEPVEALTNDSASSSSDTDETPENRLKIVFSEKTVTERMVKTLLARAGKITMKNLLKKIEDKVGLDKNNVEKLKIILKGIAEVVKEKDGVVNLKLRN